MSVESPSIPIAVPHPFLDNLSRHLEDTVDRDKMRTLFDGDPNLKQVLDHFEAAGLLKDGLREMITDHWVPNDAGGAFKDIIPITKARFREAFSLLEKGDVLDGKFEFDGRYEYEILVTRSPILHRVFMRILVPFEPRATMLAKLTEGRDLEFLGYVIKLRDLLNEALPDPP